MALGREMSTPPVGVWHTLPLPLHSAQLVVGWVTAFGYGKLSHYVTGHPGQLSLPSLQDR